MVFSSFRVKADSIRWPGETVGGLSARAPDLGCPSCGRKKSLRGWTTRQAFLPGGWTSRRMGAWKLYTNHSTEPTHGTALAARAAERSSRSGLMSRSPTGQAENKKPGGSRPTGSCGTQEAEPPGAKALRKQFGAIGAQRNRRNCAGHRCVLRGQELLHGAVRWSIFGGRRLTPRWRSGNWGVARTQRCVLPRSGRCRRRQEPSVFSRQRRSRAAGPTRSAMRPGSARRGASAHSCRRSPSRGGLRTSPAAPTGWCGTSRRSGPT